MESQNNSERRTWTYAFIILLAVSTWLLFLRHFNNSFLQFDFELTVVYLPTAIAGLAAFMSMKRPRR